MTRKTSIRVKTVSVTINSGQTSGTAVHGMGTTPTTSYPNPDRVDSPKSRAYADSVNVTVELEAPAAANTIFKVACFT